MGAGAWIFLGAILIIAAYFFGRIGYTFDDDQDSSNYAKSNEDIDKAVNAEENKTRNLLFKTLKNIGCQPEIDSEQRFIFKYQGENFSIDAGDDFMFIVIWDTWWAHMSLDDPDVVKLKEAINQTNIGARPTILYSIDEKDRTVGIHCKYALPFVAEIPYINDYLQANLDNFFITHQHLKDNFNTLIEEQISHDTKDRITIKGFKQS